MEKLTRLLAIERAAKRIKKLAEIRTTFQERLAISRPKLVPPNPPPRYDEIFENGVRWLNTL